MDPLLAEQIEYYRARAPQYDDWWERTHQYALEPELHDQWDKEKAELESRVDTWFDDVRGGRALELACGTGNWTRHLATLFSDVVAVDAAPETIAIARTKLPDNARGCVRFVEADVFSWQPNEQFDAVFFSFWISHVPPDRFESFWSMVRSALAPGGRVVFIDNAGHDGVWPPEGSESQDPVQVRTDLNSGEVRRIVKIYYEPEELAQRLRTIGWTADVVATDRFFILGTATRA